MGWQEIRFHIPAPGRVVADFGNHEIGTDHPPDDEREGRDPEPWRLFLASIGTCMASFVAARCREEGVSTDGIEIVQRQSFAESDRHPEIDVEIRVPPDFPPPAGRPRARRLRLHRQTHHRGGPTILDFAADELETIDFIQKGDVLDSVVIRMPKTYPAYFGTYGSFDLVREYTDRIENLFLIGRNGMHRYNNSDHSMLTAMMAVDNIANGVSDKSNIWNVNIDDDYHEEK